MVLLILVWKVKLQKQGLRWMKTDRQVVEQEGNVAFDDLGTFAMGRPTGDHVSLGAAVYPHEAVEVDRDVPPPWVEVDMRFSLPIPMPQAVGVEVV